MRVCRHGGFPPPERGSIAADRHAGRRMCAARPEKRNQPDLPRDHGIPENIPFHVSSAHVVSSAPGRTGFSGDARRGPQAPSSGAVPASGPSLPPQASDSPHPEQPQPQLPLPVNPRRNVRPVKNAASSMMTATIIFCIQPPENHPDLRVPGFSIPGRFRPGRRPLPPKTPPPC